MIDEVTNEPMTTPSEASAEPVVDPAAPVEPVTDASPVSVGPSPDASSAIPAEEPTLPEASSTEEAHVDAETPADDTSPATEGDGAAAQASGGSENNGLVLGYPPVAGTEASPQPTENPNQSDPHAAGPVTEGTESPDAAAVQGGATGEGSDAGADTQVEGAGQPAPVEPAPAVDVAATPDPVVVPTTSTEQAADAQQAWGGPAALGPDVAAPEQPLGTSTSAPVVGGGETHNQPAWKAILNRIGIGGGQPAAGPDSPVSAGAIPPAPTPGASTPDSPHTS